MYDKEYKIIIGVLLPGGDPGGPPGGPRGGVLLPGVPPPPGGVLLPGVPGAGSIGGAGGALPIGPDRKESDDDEKGCC